MSAAIRNATLQSLKDIHKAINEFAGNLGLNDYEIGVAERVRETFISEIEAELTRRVLAGKLVEQT